MNMNWLNAIISNADNLAHILILYSIVIAIGGILGSKKIKGIKLGATIILFVGILAGHLGFSVTPQILSFVQNIGLIIFVTCIGIHVGPKFFASFRSGGLFMVLSSVLLIIFNFTLLVGVWILFFDPQDLPMMIGMLCGAVTNTPSLGAAQETLALTGYVGEDIATSYACAYPFAVAGALLSITFLKLFTKDKISQSSNSNVTEEMAVSALRKAFSEGKFPKKDNSVEVLVAIFFSITAGVFLGSIPIPIPGCPVSAKFGLAGGSLVVAIIVGRFGEKIKLDTNAGASAIRLLRDFGLALFFSSVGIKAGANFVDSILYGDGLWYMLFGFVIAVVPMCLIGIFCMKVCGFNYHQTIGILAGSYTAPHSLSFANSISNSKIPATTYSTVYPFAMFLRIIGVQIIILILY